MTLLVKTEIAHRHCAMYLHANTPSYTSVGDFRTLRWRLIYWRIACTWWVNRAIIQPDALLTL